MARPLRTQFPGAYYHVYNRGAAQLPIVQDDRDRKVFFSILGDTVKRHHLSLYAYCLMDNHFHLFLQIDSPVLHRALQFLQTRYSKYFNHKNTRSGALFQGRYQSRMVLDDPYALTLIRYIHLNPHEAGITQKPDDYPWSSYGCYIGNLPIWPWLNTSWALNQFHQNPKTALEMFRGFHLPVSDTNTLIGVRHQ